MPPLPTIVCKECGYVNEAERVYCHGCGVKLDRTALLAQQQQRAATPEQIQREVKKRMTPRGTRFSKHLIMAVKVLASAAVVAAVIDMALPPEGLTGAQKGELLDIPPIDSALERLIASPAGQQLAVSETDINAYLKVRFKKVSLPYVSFLSLNHSLVNLDDNQGRLTLQWDIFGYPLYTCFTGRIAVDNAAGLAATCTGASIGRLHLHPVMLPYVAKPLPMALTSLKNEQQLLQRVGGIDIQKGRVVLHSRGAQAANSPDAKNPALAAPSGRP